MSKPPIPRVIAALHLPPFPASGHPAALSLPAIRDYALRNAETAVSAGVRGLYLQDLGDHPVSPAVLPHQVAGMAVIGSALRQAFPDLCLGVCFMGHGAKEPLAVVQAIQGQFVRLKVYVGAMVKAEGILQGCAYEAVSYRHAAGMEDAAIFADVYDRTGEPLGRLPLVEEARQAATFGRADGLVLTGRSFDETVEMVSEVSSAHLDVPLLIGGGVNAHNAALALEIASSIIVSTAFKRTAGWSRQSLAEDWDLEKVRELMRAIA